MWLSLGIIFEIDSVKMSFTFIMNKGLSTRNNKLALCLFATCALGLTACSHTSVDRELNRKVAEESNINTQADLNAEATHLIEKAKNITEEQRSQLLALREKTRAETLEQNKESLRLRSVLVKELLSTDYNRQEVAGLKRSIKKTDERKLSILLDAVQKTNLILGRQARDNRVEHDDDFIIRDFNFDRFD